LLHNTSYIADPYLQRTGSITDHYNNKCVWLRYNLVTYRATRIRSTHLSLCRIGQHLDSQWI